jgi:multidrug efflux pump subunit AcrB
MYKLIDWFARNSVAANLMMLVIIGYGLYSVTFKIPLEVFPLFNDDVINVSANYPGASPHEVERGLALPIEEALANFPAIKHVFSDSTEGSVLLRLEVAQGEDVNRVLSDVKTRIDAIQGFPEEAEKPIVSVQLRQREVISLAISGAVSEAELYELSKQIRAEVSRLSGISQAEITGLRPYEIAIEVSEDSLQQYQLSLSELANIIRQNSRDIPAGKIRSTSGEIRIRALGQAYRQADFEAMVIISRNDGTRIRLGDIATVKDGFTEDPLYAIFDQQRSAMIEVFRTGNQSAIQVAKTIKDYIETRQATLPSTVQIGYWKDRSRIVKARSQTLLHSAIWSSLLIFLLLSLFLHPSVALWVSVGIPISFMGALALMPTLGVSLNLISMFAFILALGVVVDDAIVTGENIYSHLQKNPNGLEAVIKATQEVSIPVTFGVLTTVAAFLPLLMIGGRMGSLFAQLPLVIIPVLLFSLIESKLILPTHMRHIKAYGAEQAHSSKNILSRLQQKVALGLEYAIKAYYQPFLKGVLNYRYLTLSIFIVIFTITIAMTMSGRINVSFYPRLQSEFVRVNLVMPEGTALEVTRSHIQHIKTQAESLQEKYIDPLTGKSIIEHILVTVGSTGRSLRGSQGGQSNLARVVFEVSPPEQRGIAITTPQLKNEWRQLIGDIAGVKALSFRAEMSRSNAPLDVQLEGQDFQQLAKVAELVKARLQTYTGVFDAKSSFEEGKEEVQLRLLPEAELLGLSLADIARQVRAAFYGIEVQRLLRNQDEIKVMMRYPQEQRRNISDLERLKIHIDSGKDIPLIELVEFVYARGASKITRVDQQRIVNVTADVNKEKINMPAVVADLKPWLDTLIQDYPRIYMSLEGEQQEQKESLLHLGLGVIFVLFVIYALLAIPFASYLQPFIVMSIIPFSVIGAIFGHIIVGMSLSISSLMGILALIGVVVNDSLVLVDYVNKQIKRGVPLYEAVCNAGQARFRPILLTSLTTFAGLLPLYFEKSTQAQFLIPMAVSLGFGILFATFITLLLIPVNYMILEDFRGLFGRLFKGKTAGDKLDDKVSDDVIH